MHVTVICPACAAIEIANGYTDHMNGGVAGEHTVPYRGERAWQFNGNADLPTLAPSLMLTHTTGEERTKFVCHSFVVDGRIQYLPDCTHAMAGQTVELPEWGEAQ
jgi:hypothetical protein